jgi:hypothetical protein
VVIGLHSHITLFARRHAETCSWIHVQLATCTHSIKQHQSPAKRSQLAPWLACDCLANLHLPRALAPSARSTTHIWCTQQLLRFLNSADMCCVVCTRPALAQLL